jgi:cobalamin biosynthesis Co2+ chelatase CbiK
MAHGTSPGSSIARLEELCYSLEQLVSLKKHNFKPLLLNQKMGLNQLSLVLKAMREEQPVSTSLTPLMLSSSTTVITSSSSSLSISPS